MFGKIFKGILCLSFFSSLTTASSWEGEQTPREDTGGQSIMMVTSGTSRDHLVSLDRFSLDGSTNDQDQQASNTRLLCSEKTKLGVAIISTAAGTAMTIVAKLKPYCSWSSITSGGSSSIVGSGNTTALSKSLRVARGFAGRLLSSDW